MTDWLFYAALALAVMGWATAFGLYLQARDAIRLAGTWREIAVDLLGRLSRERHLSEFTTRALNPSEPLPTMEELNAWRIKTHGTYPRVVDDA